MLLFQRKKKNYALLISVSIIVMCIIGAITLYYALRNKLHR